MAHRYLTSDQLADRYVVTRQHIYNLMKQGMPSLKIGSCRRFDPEATDAWLDSRQDTARERAQGKVA